MTHEKKMKLLFVINPVSGNNTTDWASIIKTYFQDNNSVTFEILELPEKAEPAMIKKSIQSFNPEIAVAVGGDGTVKLVAECLLKTGVLLGILPAGSANGMARELGIPENSSEALSLLEKRNSKKIHATRVNNYLCVHLSDIGFNAFLIKKFESLQVRGMIGYLKASAKVMFNNPMMSVEILVDNQKQKLRAAMIVIANATKYGSGAVINPVGRLDDAFFEVVVLKKISFSEIFKMTFLSSPLNPRKTEVFQTGSLSMRSVRKVHFQVDGEYMGKVNDVKAEIMPAALSVIVP